MCIIIYDNRRDSTECLDKGIFERSQEKNPHGIGIMWAHENKLYIHRTINDLDSVWDIYTNVREQSLTVALHFRKATEGTIKIENVHPFEIQPGFAFMHNGTAIDVVPYVPKGVSDTKFINTELFQNFPSSFLQSPIHRVAIENLITGGRMLFMDNKGNFSIFNETRWGATWINSIWYSKGEHLSYYLNNHKIVHYSKSEKYTDYVSDDGYGYWQEAPKHKSIIPFVSIKKEKESKKERKVRQKSLIRKARRAEKLRSSAVLGPTPSQTANLVFDYGYFNYFGHYEERIKEIGTATVYDQQLWALGDLGTEMPGALPTKNAKILGTLYEITKDYEEVLDDFDYIHGCDKGQPNISVYHRRWVKVNLCQGKECSDVWVWFYQFAMPLDGIFTAAVVPMGDWSRWATPITPNKAS